VNNSSQFIIYKWQDFKIAIGGDLESGAIESMLKQSDIQSSAASVDILIPPHHGHKNGFPTNWVEKAGKPYVSIISVQERDTSVDGRYSSPDFAGGVDFNGETRYALTTRNDGSILVSMWYDERNSARWSFSTF
jgi:hypothetical protein